MRMFITNFERITRMSESDLRDFLERGTFCVRALDRNRKCDNDCRKCIARWLVEEAKDKQDEQEKNDFLREIREVTEVANTIIAQMDEHRQRSKELGDALIKYLEKVKSRIEG